MAFRLGGMEIILGLDVKKFDKALKGVSRKFGRMGRQLSGAGQQLTMGITAPLAGIGIAAAKTAISWETAFSNVRKTVSGTEEQLQKLSAGIRGMSLELPVAAGELASIAEEAGRLGVAREDILKFTETVVRLAETSTLSSEEAAISLARLTKQTSATSADVSRLATSLTVLGSEFETNESSIAEMAQRLSVTGDVIGLSAHEILGFSAAMSAAGIQAESGGTAMGDVFIKIAAAVDQGGAELDKFSKIAGTTSEKFKKQFKTDASGALVEFVKGLRRVKESGGSVFEALENIGLSGKRQRLVLLALQKDTNGLTKALDRSKTAWIENAALQELSDKRFKTTGAEIQRLINQVVEMGRQLGDALFPAVKEIVDIIQTAFLPAIKGWIDSFKALEPSSKALIIVLLGMAAAIGPLLFMLGQLAFMLQAIAGIMTMIAAHPVAALLIGIAALVGGMAAYNAIASKMKAATAGIGGELSEAEKRVEGLRKKYKQLTDELPKAEKALKVAESPTMRKMELGMGGAALVLSRGKQSDAVKDLKKETAGLTKELLEQQIAYGVVFVAEQKSQKAKRELMAARSLESQKMELLNGLMAEEARLQTELSKLQGDEAAKALEASQERYEDLRMSIKALSEAQLENKDVTVEVADQVAAAVKKSTEEFKKNLEDQAPALEESLSVWEEWGNRMRDIIKGTSDVFKEFGFDVMQQFSDGFGRAVAATIVAGESFGDAMKGLWKSIASTIISRLVSIGVQLVLFSAIEKAVLKSSVMGTVGAKTVETFVGAYASVIKALPFPANVLAAPIVAGAQAAVVAGAGAKVPFLAEGGILTSPQLVMAGEAGPEAVIPLDRLGEFTGGRQTVNLYIDGELVTEAVIEGMPSVLEARLGGI